MAYISSTRSLDNVEFEALRKKIDKKYNDLHDELSDCYYNNKEFKDYGILDKVTFDKLHGLIFLMRDKKFHEENLKADGADKIDASKYDDIKDDSGVKIGSKYEKALIKIEDLKNEGIELSI